MLNENFKIQKLKIFQTTCWDMVFSNLFRKIDLYLLHSVRENEFFRKTVENGPADSHCTTVALLAQPSTAMSSYAYHTNVYRYLSSLSVWMSTLFHENRSIMYV